MLTLAAETTTALDAAKWIPTLPFLAMLVNAALFFSGKPGLKALAGWVTTAAIGAGFAITCTLWSGLPHGEGHAATGVTVHFFDWIRIGDFKADFSFYIDALTLTMLSVVTGIGTLIALYAQGYMKGDPGFARFFAYIALFIFAMTCLVMGDNLLLLYLGWEGVGLASFLLIGYYYRKPSAVAAAKKAFIVNRVGDFGFALGLMGVWVVFNSIGYHELLGGSLEELKAKVATLPAWKQTLTQWIPYLLMLGAFGKSAQLPLHVWLPDAMEGPTPVSALIHAATMVTAGVYMISRLILIFQLNPDSLALVATIGAVTAFFAGSIALCQYDIKRVWAYSTVSQLGYMLLGVGVMSTTGAVFHLFTHAFFKALLFLTAGSVMHGLAGQLDMRHMSGLLKKMPVTGFLMLIGCVALAGVPYTSGWFSKDMILVEALAKYPNLGWIGIATALITAFYTFRLWFRVFMGPTEYKMGDEVHGYSAAMYPDEVHGGGGHGHDHGHSDNGHAHDAHGHAEHHHHDAHEMPFWPMNLPLMVLAVGAIAAGFMGEHFITNSIAHSTAAVHAAHDEAAKAAHDHAHHTVSLVGWIALFVMIPLAAFFYWFNRGLTEKLAGAFSPIVKLLNNKYYIDEAYNAVIVGSLRAIAFVCQQIDTWIVDKLIIDTLLGRSPKIFGALTRTGQNEGLLQGYARGMAVGLAVIVLLVAWKVLAP